MDQKFTEGAVAAALDVPTAVYLGTGSFGETWRIDTHTGPEAVKIIHVDDYDDERLRREVIGYQRVTSPHVVELLRTQVVTVAGKARAAMVFRYIPGGDLEHALQTRRPGPNELHGLARGLLKGIAAMHGADLLHRDLKPANVALQGGDFTAPVVLDLGLTKLLDVDSITKYPTHIGTLLYMAPEQLRQERALRASDLWAVGVILYEAAVGQHPFIGPDERLPLEELLQRMETSVLVPQGTRLPTQVSDLIGRCLSYQAYRRGTVDRALARLEEGASA